MLLGTAWGAHGNLRNNEQYVHKCKYVGIGLVAFIAPSLFEVLCEFNIRSCEKIETLCLNWVICTNSPNLTSKLFPVPECQLILVPGVYGKADKWGSGSY